MRGIALSQPRAMRRDGTNNAHIPGRMTGDGSKNQQ
jgi:hypothetical protein